MVVEEFQAEGIIHKDAKSERQRGPFGNKWCGP